MRRRTVVAALAVLAGLTACSSGPEDLSAGAVPTRWYGTVDEDLAGRPEAHFQPGDPPGCRSWVQVRAHALDPGQLLAALKAGAYYSSTGPEIHGVDLVGDALHVTCSPVDRILLTGGSPGCQLATGDGLTEATIPLGFLTHATHVRITVVTSTGQRAWTDPLWRDLQIETHEPG